MSTSDDANLVVSTTPFCDTVLKVRGIRQQRLSYGNGGGELKIRGKQDQKGQLGKTLFEQGGLEEKGSAMAQEQRRTKPLLANLLCSLVVETAQEPREKKGRDKLNLN
jgi:hypothetical protein